MEIVMEDKSCYRFRKSVSHLPGSFTSFWQAYLKMKPGLKCCFPLSFFIYVSALAVMRNVSKAVGYGIQ